MGLVASVLVGLVALLHFYILVLEMFLWTTPKGHKAFGLTPEFAETSKVLAANQRALQRFLGAGLAWGLARGDVATQAFFLGCVFVAGVTARPRPTARSCSFRHCRRWWLASRSIWRDRLQSLPLEGQGR